MSQVLVAVPMVDPRSIIRGGMASESPWEQRVGFALAGLACAPSVHNTQPWAVRLLDDRRLEVWADDARWLTHLDPRRRQLHISLGCALFGLRTAARGAGLQAHATVLPRGHIGPAFAVTLDHGRTASDQEAAAAACLRQRRTVRGAFADRAVSEGLTETLSAVAGEHHTTLTLVVPGPQMRELGRLTADATWQQEQDVELIDEITRWTRSSAHHAVDGVPVSAWGPPASRSAALPQRDFAGSHPAVTSRLVQPEGPPPLAVIISSERDDARGWLDAGEALHHLLLAAWAAGVAGCPVDAAVELPGTNHDLRRAFNLARAPQVVLRLGHPVGRPSRLTPRRPLQEILHSSPS